MTDVSPLVGVTTPRSAYLSRFAAATEVRVTEVLVTLTNTVLVPSNNFRLAIYFSSQNNFDTIKLQTNLNNTTGPWVDFLQPDERIEFHAADWGKLVQQSWSANIVSADSRCAITELLAVQKRPNACAL